MRADDQMQSVGAGDGDNFSGEASQSALDRGLLAAVEMAGEGKAQDEAACARIEEFLKAGARPSARRDNARRDALILAVGKGLEKTCKALIAGGADTSIEDCGQFTAMAWAARAGNDELIWALAPLSDMGHKMGGAGGGIWEAIAGRCAWERTAVRWTPENPEPEELGRAMMWAVSGSCDKIASAAVARLAELGSPTSRSWLGGVGKDSRELVTVAIRAGNDGAVEALIAAGADLSARDADGRGAFAWAALMGRERALRLLAPMSDVNEKDKQGDTALTLSLLISSARPRGYVGALEFLVSVSELESSTSGGKSILTLARSIGDKEAAGLIEREMAKREALAIDGVAGAPKPAPKARKLL